MVGLPERLVRVSEVVVHVVERHGAGQVLDLLGEAEKIGRVKLTHYPLLSEWRKQREDRVLESLGITTTAEEELEIRAAEATAATLVKALGKTEYFRQSVAMCQRRLSPPPHAMSRCDVPSRFWCRPTSPHCRAERPRGVSAAGLV